jgi:hypothetical protein
MTGALNPPAMRKGEAEREAERAATTANGRSLGFTPPILSHPTLVLHGVDDHPSLGWISRLGVRESMTATKSASSNWRAG